MRVVNVRNVSQAWARLPSLLEDAEVRSSRGGAVLVCPEPVATVYRNPTERVLLDARRDANPFFHLVEALWMLAGRNDVASLTPYVRDFDTYAEADGTVHGAYGHRWRHAMWSDQLRVIVAKLQENPEDRQAVLQMWDAAGQWDLGGEWRDRPCNTHAYFRVRDNSLHMTVCCRSNDMVFGGYGANAVHFSVLLEYMAARIGVSVGTYTQISNNFHVYQDVWERRRPLAPGHTSVPCAPMFSNPEKADDDVLWFMQWHDLVQRSVAQGADPVSLPVSPSSFSNTWFGETATPMVLAHTLFRAKGPLDAHQMTDEIICPAWRRAAQEWLVRRGQHK